MTALQARARDAAAEREPYRCCGCGKEAVGDLKPCDCPTQCGYRRGARADGIVFRTLPNDQAAEAREAKSAGACACAEVYGENPRCILHGRGTEWSKANPDICELAEKAAAYDDLTAKSAGVDREAWPTEEEWDAHTPEEREAFLWRRYRQERAALTSPSALPERETVSERPTFGFDPEFAAESALRARLLSAIDQGAENVTVKVDDLKWAINMLATPIASPGEGK